MLALLHLLLLAFVTALVLALFLAALVVIMDEVSKER